MASRRLTFPGSLLLLTSLLITLGLSRAANAQASSLLIWSWLAMVGLLIGSGLFVAGAVLRVLQPAKAPEPRRNYFADA